MYVNRQAGRQAGLAGGGGRGGEREARIIHTKVITTRNKGGRRRDHHIHIFEVMVLIKAVLPDTLVKF